MGLVIALTVFAVGVAVTVFGVSLLSLPAGLILLGLTLAATGLLAVNVSAQRAGSRKKRGESRGGRKA